MSKTKKVTLAKVSAVSFILFAVALIIQSVSAEAGDRHRGWKSPEKAVERLKERLALTEDQVPAVKAAFEQGIKKRRDIADKYREQRSELKGSIKSEMMTVRNDTEEQLAAILTDEQMQKFKSLKKERRNHTSKHSRRCNQRGLQETFN